jgi:hypothetical protein
MKSLTAVANFQFPISNFQFPIRPASRLLHSAFYAAVACVLVAGCATVHSRPRPIGPFTRAVLLFYEMNKLSPYPDSVFPSDALSWLTLERGTPKTITVVCFDEKDRPIAFSRRPSQWTWTSSSNVHVQPMTDGPTARATLTDGDTGWLEVSVAGYIGNIRVVRQGYRKSQYSNP